MLIIGFELVSIDVVIMFNKVFVFYGLLCIVFKFLYGIVEVILFVVIIDYVVELMVVYFDLE